MFPGTHSPKVCYRFLQFMLTFTGGSIEAVAAQLTGHAPETCITGTGAVTKVTVITFTTVIAERADAARTDWIERETQSS